MAITAKEIATLAGVSRGTVDRALKGRPGIAEETKQKILEIAKKYEYKPNIIGKALVYSGKPIQVAVLLNSVGNPFFDEVKRGIFAAEEAFQSYGFQVTLSEFKGYSHTALLELLNALPEDTAQVILTPICHPDVKAKLQEMLSRGVRIVMLSAAIENLPGAVYVGCDYLKSGRIAGRLTGLLSAGHANLFIMNGNAQHAGHAQRVEGIRAIIENEYPKISLVGVAENDDDDDVAYRVMKDALKMHPEIDFVYITAAGVNGTLRAIREHSRDVRVCTFDDTSVTREALCQGSVLATICQQPFEQGYQAVKVLFDSIVLKNAVQTANYTELFVKVDQSL
ncbi:MAG: LacI family DNA-binding transcriptional regulator [Clostridia bacterium]|nr:LacI family DNA-binding transcriptional regulator [Clostridia bacterium]